ncbi:hypothetical protein H6F97_09985, partial [Microcoleus sp. FACHB-1]|nr:hypothetical protein [Microcoleus sp. FACHB-1]
MIAQSTRYAVCLGLAGGLAVALTPAVNAQIQVTGGNFNGQAAFFVPTPGTGGTTSSGKVELFDLTVQTLNLQTSRGNTSTAVFQPTAALFNAGSDNQPNANDTGTVKGLLSGLAFTGNGGTPIPFTNRVTILNFSVNSFTSSANNSGVIEGTMLSPQTAGQNPLIFLPNVEATVAPGSSYQATSGELTLGSLDAKLTTGAIDLPQSYTFQQTGSTTTTPPTDTVSRRIKFMFQGDNVIPETGTNFNGTSNNTGNSNTGNNNTGNNNTGNNNTGNNNTGNNNTGNNNNQIRFVGQANKKFTIETVGNQSNGQYKIDSTLGAVDIKIGGPFTNATTTGTLSNTASTTYKIEGESNGILSLFALNSVGFSSTANSTSPSNTTFEFQQGGNKLTGSSTGSVDFYAVAGVNSFNSDTAFTNYQPTSSNNSTPGSNPPCNVCGNTLANNSSVLLGSTTITIGGPISVGTGSGSGSGSGSGGTGSNSGGSGNTSGGSGSGGSGNTSGGSGSGGSGNTSGGSGSGGSGNTSGGSGSGGSGSASGGSGSGSGSGGSGSGGSTDTDANPANTDVFASGGTAYSSTAQGQYQILASSNIRLVTDVKLRASKIKVKVVQRGSDRYYVVYREGSGSSGQGSSGSGSASGTGTGTTTGTGTGTTTGTGTGTTTGTTTGTGTGTGTTTGTTTGTGTGTGTTTGTT